MKSRFFYLIIVLTSFAFPLAAQDEVHYQRDSVVEKKEDCSEGFFERLEKIPDPARIRLVAKNQRTYSLTSFLKLYNMGGFTEYGLTDLDQDGKKELIISNFTGGAHCCDEIYIFRNTGVNKFQYVAKTFAGNVCFTETNELIFSFYESFGYFFTCYACSYQDSTDVAPIPVDRIILQYQPGKLKVKPGDAELRSMIRDNLSKLAEHPYEALDDISQDNGLRKEFALNLAVFYYAFGKNIVETQKLFNSWYRFPDAKKVWAEFNRILQGVKKQNDF